MSSVLEEGGERGSVLHVAAKVANSSGCGPLKLRQCGEWIAWLLWRQATKNNLNARRCLVYGTKNAALILLVELGSAEEAQTLHTILRGCEPETGIAFQCTKSNKQDLSTLIHNPSRGYMSFNRSYVAHLQAKYGDRVHINDVLDSDIKQSTSSSASHHKSSSGAVYVVKARGFPYTINDSDICEFFGDVSILELDMVTMCKGLKKPRFIGDCFLQLGSVKDVKQALTHHKEYSGDRYVEVFESSVAELVRKGFQPYEYPGGDGHSTLDIDNDGAREPLLRRSTVQGSDRVDDDMECEFDGDDVGLLSREPVLPAEPMLRPLFDSALKTSTKLPQPQQQPQQQQQQQQGAFSAIQIESSGEVEFGRSLFSSRAVSPLIVSRNYDTPPDGLTMQQQQQQHQPGSAFGHSNERRHASSSSSASRSGSGASGMSVFDTLFSGNRGAAVRRPPPQLASRSATSSPLIWTQSAYSLFGDMDTLGQQSGQASSLLGEPAIPNAWHSGVSASNSRRRASVPSGRSLHSAPLLGGASSRASSIMGTSMSPRTLAAHVGPSGLHTQQQPAEVTASALRMEQQEASKLRARVAELQDATEGWKHKAIHSMWEAPDISLLRVLPPSQLNQLRAKYKKVQEMIEEVMSERSLCQLCAVDVADVMYEPCRHVAVCKSCAKLYKSSDCSVCGARVESSMAPLSPNRDAKENDITSTTNESSLLDSSLDLDQSTSRDILVFQPTTEEGEEAGLHQQWR